MKQICHLLSNEIHYTLYNKQIPETEMLHNYFNICLIVLMFSDTSSAVAVRDNQELIKIHIHTLPQQLLSGKICFLISNVYLDGSVP